MRDPYGLELSGLPPELALEMANLQKKQKVQEAMLAQGMAPGLGPIDAGRYKVARSPFEGVAKVLQAYMGAQGMKDVEAGQAGIAEKYKTGLADAVSQYTRTKAGAPEIPVPADDLGGGPGAPAQPGDPRKAIMDAMMSNYPQLQRVGQMDLTQLNRGEDRRDQQAFLAEQKQLDRQARIDAIEVQAKEGRISREEADRRAGELRKEMADQAAKDRENLVRVTASLRQAPDRAPVVTEVVRDGKRIKIDARTGRVIGDAAPTAAMDKVANVKRKLSTDLNEAITELERATADGGLIDKSTGSGAGAAFDFAASLIGKSTPGAIAVGQTKPIFDLVLKMVPRFEGPQSDKDTASYKEAAGNLANPNVPNDIKKTAGREILRLMKARRAQFINKDDVGTEADVGAIPDAPPPGAVRPRN